MKTEFTPPPEGTTRNSEVLASFVAYCKANPELRFWQALLNWSNLGFIIHSNVTAYEINDVLRQSGVAAKIEVEDTYYWEGKNQ